MLRRFFASTSFSFFSIQPICGSPSHLPVHCWVAWCSGSASVGGLPRWRRRLLCWRLVGCCSTSACADSIALIHSCLVYCSRWRVPCVRVWVGSGHYHMSSTVARVVGKEGGSR